MGLPEILTDVMTCMWTQYKRVEVQLYLSNNQPQEFIDRQSVKTSFVDISGMSKDGALDGVE